MFMGFITKDGVIQLWAIYRQLNLKMSLILTEKSFFLLSIKSLQDQPLVDLDAGGILSSPDASAAIQA